MISEAAITGKPIYVAQMPAVKSNTRFKEFFKLFSSLNIIKNLDSAVEKWDCAWHRLCHADTRGRAR